MDHSQPNEGARLAHSTQRAAVHAGVSERTLAREIAAGRLIARKVGRRTVIEDSALSSWLRSLPRAGAAA